MRLQLTQEGDHTDTLYPPPENALIFIKPGIFLMETPYPTSLDTITFTVISSISVVFKQHGIPKYNKKIPKPNDQKAKGTWGLRAKLEH